MSRVANIKTAQKPTPKSAAHQARSKAGAKAASRRNVFFSYSSADDRNILNIIDVVRTGITYNDFIKLVNYTPFSLSEWAFYLQLSERTLQRNQKEKKPFQPIQSERIVELSMLYQYGVEVFGDKDNFDTWLNSKSVALGGRAPKELLDTKFGISMVKDALTRIEHGVLA
jgi:putative toxin-antitoxin system antitoxin component (TIGR02293 family)